MAISRFASRFKTRTDLMDNITPNNVVQANVSVPHGEWKPASWLPVVWQNEKSKDFFVISSGKVVSFDSSGRVVPSGLLRRCLDASAHSTVIIDYDANDKAARVIDITTGEFVAGAKDVTLRAFIKAAFENGWLPGETLPNENGDAAELAALIALAKKFISAPVGICAYDVYCWAGDDPANLHFTNYQKQHLIQFFTDIQMKAAQVAASSTQTDNKASLELISNADLIALPRYKGLAISTDVVGLRLTKPAAASTSRTPFAITFSDATVARKRSEPSLISKAGDFYLDDEASTLLIFESGGNAKPGNLTSVTYYQYDGATSSFANATEEKYIHFVGDCKPGDFVTFDKLSNMTVLGNFDLSIGNSNSVLADAFMQGTDAEDASAVKGSIDGAVNALRDALETALESRHFEESLVIGRVMDIIKEPRGLLERVKTGFKGEEFDASAKMPGSATGGFSDMIVLSGELQTVADQIVVVNVKI